ncbi:MAG: oligopeptide transporter, OPT family [Acidobacteriota bacterium]|nr:oligopeptide transporter, OPT family [Acidobacteriota bacterium]MEE3138432.1 oligopeptide transporter, OPT family [Acidobacteriota bacterium]
MTPAASTEVGRTGPVVPASQTLPEITAKAVVLGVVLSIILAAANAYLGLFAGMTVSASIPAAVVSMAVLRLFTRSNILENNIVQTAASAGESLAAGVIFTIPALIILGTWTDFRYWEVTVIAAFGGLLGVLFTIPLRRALIVEQPLKYPEGVATAEVLKVAAEGGGGVGYLATAGGIGALFKLGGLGLKLWPEVIEYARLIGGSIAYIGTNLSPALVGVGYIVGLNIAVLLFIGGMLNWWIAIPVLLTTGVAPTGDPAAIAGHLWSTQTRYLGVGAMLIGGLWALVRLRASLVSGIRSGMEAYRRINLADGAEVPRTEIDAPMPWIFWTLIVSVVPLFFIFNFFTGSIWVSAVMAAVMLVAGFLFSAVAGYMSGLVGSSNNPISGVTIATLLVSSLLLLVLLGADTPIGPSAALLIAAVIACAGAIAGDNMQDLKAGYLVGATPYKQQIMQAVGVIAAAAVMAPILTLLLRAYGIGIATAAHPDPLAAPQATLMASVAGSVFGGGLPWTMVLVGMAIAVIVIVADLMLERRASSFRAPVLAVAVGIYLPFELEVPIFVGGLIAWFAEQARRRHGAGLGERHGLLFAAGLITGEAIVGILMAIPIVITSNPNVLAVGLPPRTWFGFLLLVGITVGLYRSATSSVARA